MYKYQREELQVLIDAGKSLKEIGYRYGVTRQRMYQVFNALNIPTLEKRRKCIVRDELDERQRWAWKILCTRIPGRNKIEKMDILRSLDFPDVCPVLGIPLTYTFGKGQAQDSSPSFDQKIPGGGYTKENIQVVSWRANRIKNDGTPEEHQKIADFYKFTK